MLFYFERRLCGGFAFFPALTVRGRAESASPHGSRNRICMVSRFHHLTPGCSDITKSKTDTG
jgi:hypothetical protein